MVNDFYYVSIIFGTCLLLCLFLIFYGVCKPQDVWKDSSMIGSFNDKTRTVQDFLAKNLPNIFQNETKLGLYYITSLSHHHFYSLFSTQRSDGRRLLRLDHCFDLLFHFYFIFLISIIIAILSGQSSFGFNDCSTFSTNSSCSERRERVWDWYKMCQWNSSNNACSPVHDHSIWSLRVFLMTSMFCSVGASAIYGLIHPVVKTICDYLSVIDVCNTQTYPEPDVEESKQSSSFQLSEYDDEFCKFQSRKGAMLKAVRCQLMHQSIDFVPPKRELEELLNPDSKVRAWRQSPQSFDGSINICNYFKYQFQVWKHYYYSIGNPDLAFEAVNQLRIHRPDILIHRIRESRKKSEEIRFHLMGSSLTDRDRDALLYRFFLCNWFSGCDQLIAKRLMIDPFIRKPKKVDQYSPFMVHKVVAFFLTLMIFVVTLLAASLLINDPLSTTLCLVSTGISHFVHSFVVLPFRILFCEMLCPQIIRNKILKLHQVLQARLQYIAKRDSGLLVRVQSLIQHYHPACRTARLLPWLPISRILIALHDFDLPTSTYQEWKPTYRVLSSNTGSPLIADFVEVLSKNMAMRIFYAFFRLLHYFLMFVKLILNVVLIMPLGLQSAVIDVSLAVSLYGSLLLVLTQSDLGWNIAVIGILALTIICGVVHSFRWYWWYPYVRILWDNDWLSPKRKSYIRKKPKRTKTIKTFPR